MSATSEDTIELRLADRIRTAWRDNARLRFEASEVPKWAAAIGRLIAEGDFGPARHAATQFCTARPDLAYARTIVELLDRIPAEEPATLPFRDDIANDLQVLPRERADTVLLIFGDYLHSAGVPFSVAHRWLGRLPVSLVYLRDFRRLFFEDGLAQLGAGRSAAITGLRSIVRSLRADRVLCLGCSAGGFAAMRYGLELPAAKVLGVGGMYDLSPDTAIRRDVRSQAYRSHPLSREPANLREVYLHTPHPPLARLVYSEGNMLDRTRAHHMDGLGGVSLRPIANTSTHLLVTELIKRDGFDDELRWLVAA